MIVKWTKDSLGAVVSRCGRFLIRADFMGTTRAQGYTLMDEKGKESSHFTQRGAKNHAQVIIEQESVIKS